MNAFAHHGSKVLREMRRVHGVHAHDDGFVAPLRGGTAKELAQQHTRLVFARFSHGVFEVERQGIGRTRQGL